MRDSGLTHALLGVTTFEDLLAHPVVGASWEGFVIEMLISAAPFATSTNFYRTASVGDRNQTQPNAKDREGISHGMR
ncbi:DUF4143 domain-containing protein [Mesorhizobium yinganensis]|uniref:DUF4143 domain-containing protein n=1 Tax=Mesorhizobium yinganensis TaxID=3157707 RepID=UPI0032B834C2